MRVLAVDDNEKCLHAVAELVRAAGLDLVALARSGEEALLFHAELEPDAVLLDVHLPGIDGRETARRIVAARAATRVVLISATAAPDVVRKETLSASLLRELLG
jgi:CheY-like chemotaxis protein